MPRKSACRNIHHQPHPSRRSRTRWTCTSLCHTWTILGKKGKGTVAKLLRTATSGRYISLRPSVRSVPCNPPVLSTLVYIRRPTLNSPGIGLSDYSRNSTFDTPWQSCFAFHGPSFAHLNVNPSLNPSGLANSPSNGNIMILYAGIKQVSSGIYPENRSIYAPSVTCSQTGNSPTRR